MSAVRTSTAIAADPTATVFPGDGPRTIRLELAAGQVIRAYSHPDREIVFLCHRASLRPHNRRRIYAIEVGEIARFSDEREVSPEAREDATALLVLAPA